MIAVVNVALGAVILLFAPRRRSWLWITGTVLGAALILWLAYDIGWRRLKPRLETVASDLEGRESTYEIGRQMAADFPLFGTGAKTFSPLFQMYRPSPETFWLAQMHNDWLETRITFGWVGGALIVLALVVVLVLPLTSGGLRIGAEFPRLLWLSLAGCLIHARYDFPLQIQSVLFVFVLLCACLVCCQHRRFG